MISIELKQNWFLWTLQSLEGHPYTKSVWLREFNEIISDHPRTDLPNDDTWKIDMFNTVKVLDTWILTLINESNATFHLLSEKMETAIKTYFKDAYLIACGGIERAMTFNTWEEALEDASRRKTESRKKARQNKKENEEMKKLNNQHSDLKSLGSGKTDYKYDFPSKSILEFFPNNFPEDYLVTLTFNEFTSLCPKTGQPDFAKIQIEYIPHYRCVETKSLKLYFFAFRQYGSFMESIVNKIKDDLVEILEPKEIDVIGTFNPRGGIELVVRASYISPSPNSRERK